jgi:leucyl aminopeptidase
MKTNLSGADLLEVACDLLVLPVHDRDTDEDLRRVDRALEGRLLAEARHQKFGGGDRKELLFQTHGRLPSRNVLLAAVPGTPQPTDWQQLADAVARAIKATRAARACVAVRREPVSTALSALTEGVTLARYEFNRFRSRPQVEPPLTLTLVVAGVNGARRKAIRRGEITASATCYARDLANTPAGSLTPRSLASEAQQLAGAGLTVRIHDRGAIRRLKMGALMGVAQGSREAPFLIELIYRPARRARRRVALVGKGITFDSGGLSLKPADSMQAQKRDMAGGAVVLAVMQALRPLGLPVEVHGYVPAAENMPDGGALRPGDVVRAHNGKTIEVLNTDAEGRLVLADALSYAAAKRPDVMIDFATLTAAVRTALGSRYAAVMGNDRTVTAALIAAAAEVGERLWELPLAEEYRSDIDSRVADIKNIGEGHAGTIVGGLFLREFVGGVPWAHVDFSSTVMSEGYPCNPKGASGYGVRTALRYLEKVVEADRGEGDRSPVTGHRSPPA